MPVAVLIANATVRPMDHNFRPLVDRDLTRGSFRFGLRVVNAGESFIALATNAPAIVIWNYMLIFAHFLFS
jgi:hypothetical protein